jgi:hypothetical protein
VFDRLSLFTADTAGRFSSLLCRRLELQQVDLKVAASSKRNGVWHDDTHIHSMPNHAPVVVSLNLSDSKELLRTIQNIEGSG